MKRITHLDPATVTGKTKELLDAVHSKLGILPNPARVGANGYIAKEAACLCA
jgi:hypothetical protein